MMRQITIGEISDRGSQLFLSLEGHLGVASILRGLTPGAVYVDNPDNPTLGIAWFHSRVYLCGELGSLQAAKEVSLCFLNDLLPQMQAAQMGGFVLHTAPEVSDEFAANLLPGFRNGRAMRRHYTCRPPALPVPALPAGYALRQVNAALIAEPGLEGKDWLYEEMLSERESAEAFLQKSFGVALIHQNEIIGWCLSEYNCEGRCEVGVAVAEAYQQRGLGTVLATALVNEAFNRGYHEIGWHCWAANEPSARLAERSGFRLQSEFPVWFWIIRAEETS